MNKIVILLATVAILSGCSSSPTETAVQTPTPLGSIANPSTNPNYQATVPAEETSVSPSLVDQVAIDGAVRLNDPSYCEKISDANVKQQCLDALKPQEQVKPAEINCEKLSNEDEKEACFLEKQIAEQLKQQAIKEAKEVADGIVKRDQFVERKDLASCKSLTIFGQRMDCEINILVHLALEKSDKTICSQASIPEAKEACEINFDKSMVIKADGN